MEVRCPNCSSRFNLPEQFAKAGTKLRCTVCKTVFAFDPAEQLATQGPLPDMPVTGRIEEIRRFIAEKKTGEYFLL